MRKVKWDAFLSGLCGFVVALGLVAAGARADVTTEKGASIVVFPKILVNGTFDTIIQITNTGNSMLHAHCFYVDASLQSTLSGLPCTVPSVTCLPRWQETDFLIWFTKQQPTHWTAGDGRNIDITDGFKNDGSGFDIGRVPPLNNFEGELKCIEVSESGEPITGNHLKGEATLVVKTGSSGGDIANPGTDKGDVSKYNAIGIQGNPDVQPTNPLLLNGEVYDACPEKLIVNHFATGTSDPIADDASAQLGNVITSSSVATEITLVPCSEDFENQRPTAVKIQFLVYNEYEQPFSASTTVICYLSTELTEIDSPGQPTRSAFSANLLGSDVAQTEIRPVAATDGSVGALVGITERIVSVSTTSGTATAREIFSMVTEGSLIPAEAPPDSITLPLSFD
jgi:hypothetical protein